MINFRFWLNIIKNLITLKFFCLLCRLIRMINYSYIKRDGIAVLSFFILIYAIFFLIPKISDIVFHIAYGFGLIAEFIKYMPKNEGYFQALVGVIFLFFWFVWIKREKVFRLKTKHREFINTYLKPIFSSLNVKKHFFNIFDVYHNYGRKFHVLIILIPLLAGLLGIFKTLKLKLSYKQI